MMRRLITSFVHRFPLLHSVARAVHAHRVLACAPVRTPMGFYLKGTYLMEAGQFEPEETQRISTLLLGTDVFVNVGANTGYYVCLARQTGCRVVAIEPLDQNVQLLQRNLLANGWADVEVLPVGLGDRVSSLKLYGGGTAASFIEGWAGASREHYRIVPVTTLDNILADRFSNQRVLIVIDVEGFELNVLRGAVRQLVRNPAPQWFVEICVDEHQPDGVRINPNMQQTFQMFWSHGYRAERVGVESSPVSREDVERWVKGEDLPQTHNFLFYKDGCNEL